MKREIKFRVWDKAKCRMLGVDQLAFGLDGELVSIYSDGPDFSNDSEALMGEKPDLNDAVLMQYTGLHDKNGREIYEGDILYFGSVWCVGDECDPREEDHTGLVEYRPDYASYVVNCNGKIYPLEQLISFDGYSVQGNVHENPELIARA